MNAFGKHIFGQSGAGFLNECKKDNAKERKESAEECALAHGGQKMVIVECSERKECDVVL